MNRTSATALRGIFASAALLLIHTGVHALSISGSGLVGGSAVSASADFSTSGTNLVITLKNTTAGGTPTKTQVLTGLFFTIDGSNPVLSLAGTGTTLGTSSLLYTDATHSTNSADLNGSYLFLSHPGGTLSQSFPYEYGLGCVGAGGLFPAGQFTKGGGGDDYAIVASGTDLSLSTFKNDFPYEENSVQFTLNGFGSTDLSRITGVTFMFGSDGTGIVSGTSSVPEPGVAALLAGCGVTGTLLHLRRRRRSSAG